MRYIASRTRIIRLRLFYPGFAADRGTYIGPDCDIFCSNESQILFRGATLGRGVYIHADQGGVIEVVDSSIGRFSAVTTHDRTEIGPGVALAAAVTGRGPAH